MRLMSSVSRARLLIPRALLVLAAVHRHTLEATDGTRLALHDVPADGDCLFSAVATSAALADGSGPPGEAELHATALTLRAAALRLLCPHGRPSTELEFGGLPAVLVVEPLGGEDGAGYCERMARPGEWGSIAELLALTRVLGRPIRVHLLDEELVNLEPPTAPPQPVPPQAVPARMVARALSSELYGAEEKGAPIAVAFSANHYRAVKAHEAAHEALRLRGGLHPSSSSAARDGALGAAVGKEPHAPQDAACFTSHVEPTRRTATRVRGDAS